MPDDDHKHSGHFDAAMPLPDEVKIKRLTAANESSKSHGSQDAAADLIRQRVEAAYAKAPAAAAEVDEVNQIAAAKQSKHQKFIDNLINSGKSLPEIQAAWHEYYAGLTDHDKYQVWHEFYAEHEKNSRYGQATKSPEPKRLAAQVDYRKHIKRVREHVKKLPQLKAPADSPPTSRPTHRPAASPLHSLAFGLGIGMLVIVIFLFSFFNERFIAPFIQPSRTVTNTPIIDESTVISPNPEIIIPKINVEIPVIYTVPTIDPDAVENALEGGVVHYADTALPGQDGNLVIVGHSSNNIFNQGKYKFAFVLLSRLQSGDTFYLDKDGVRYTYQVYQKEIVDPNDVSVLGAQAKPATATLITCDPPGTSNNRLVVVGQQISPDPSANIAAASGDNSLATKSAIIPGNSPTLWSRIVKWFES